MSLRVISGTARGRKLKSVPGDTTRPVMDRVKEALFNILMDDVIDSNWWDLFGGTGAIGRHRTRARRRHHPDGRRPAERPRRHPEAAREDERGLRVRVGLAQGAQRLGRPRAAVEDRQRAHHAGWPRDSSWGLNRASGSVAGLRSHPFRDSDHNHPVQPQRSTHRIFCRFIRSIFRKSRQRRTELEKFFPRLRFRNDHLHRRTSCGSTIGSP